MVMSLEPGEVPGKEPLAYFLTWTTYGSWLPGDERGWVAKPGQFRAPDPARKQEARQRMTETPLTLDPEQRRMVEDTIADHCRIRGWHMHAVNARAQHVHVVVTAPGRDPKEVRDQFKAWCTRRLKQREQTLHGANQVIRQHWWTERGSERWLNNSESLEAAIRYVLECQGEPTPRPTEPLSNSQAQRASEG
jgi:REP element-mobilizing transposase RayT